MVALIMAELISIIVPVYNLEAYIERTLDSICNQSYKNIEVVVVDDGSNDNSWNKIVNYSKKDNRIIPVRQENGGVTSARLNGVNHSNGEWIGFVDGDDTIDTDMYEFLINNAHKYNVKISHCGNKMFFNDGRINYYYNTGCIVEQDNLKGLCDLLDGTMIEPSLCNKLFHKSLFHNLLKYNLMDLFIKNYEDLLMNYYLFKQSNNSVYEDVCKYNYMIRNNSASTSAINDDMFYGTLKVFEIIMNDSKENVIIDSAFSRYIGALIRFSTCESKSIQKKSINILKKNNKKICFTSSVSFKQKMMFLLTAYLHPVYLLIRIVYEKIIDINKNKD